MGGAPERVETVEEFAAFVGRVGFCTWQRFARVPGLPSLEEASGWSGFDLFNHTWFWKDDLHIEKRLCYGPFLAAAVPCFVSLPLLPVLIAAQGDNDPRTLCERNRLPHAAVRLYEHIEREGQTATNKLPVTGGERQRSLAALQRTFLLTKVGLTGRGRGTYGYVWGRCEDHYAEAFEVASGIRVETARERFLAHLNDGSGAELTMRQAARLLHWHEP